MKRKILITLISILGIIISAAGCNSPTDNPYDGIRPSENFNWAKNAGPSQGSVGYGVAVDKNGNSYVIGTFNKQAKLDSISMTLTGVGEFLAKFSSDGKALWAVYIDGTEAAIYDVSVDNSDNVLVGGHFAAGAKLLPGSQTVSAESSVLKFDSGGNLLSSIPGSGTTSKIFIDGSNNLYAASVMDTSASGLGKRSAVSNRIYFSKYNSGGSLILRKEFADPAGAEIKSIAVDLSGNIVLAGTFLGTMNIDSHVISTASNYAFYVIKLDPSGNYLWSNTGESESIGESLVIDNQGNSIFYGFYDYAMKIDSVVFVAFASRGMFLAKYGSDGKLLQAKNLSAQPMSNGDIKLDAAGNVYIANGFYGIINVPGADLVSSSGDICIAKFDPNLQPLWGEMGNCAAPGYVYGLAVDNSSNCLLTGQFQSKVIFGNFTLQAGVQPEFYLAKIKAH